MPEVDEEVAEDRVDMADAVDEDDDDESLFLSLSPEASADRNVLLTSAANRFLADVEPRDMSTIDGADDSSKLKLKASSDEDEDDFDFDNEEDAFFFSASLIRVTGFFLGA